MNKKMNNKEEVTGVTFSISSGVNEENRYFSNSTNLLNIIAASFFLVLSAINKFKDYFYY